MCEQGILRKLFGGNYGEVADAWQEVMQNNSKKSTEFPHWQFFGNNWALSQLSEELTVRISWDGCQSPLTDVLSPVSAQNFCVPVVELDNVVDILIFESEKFF